MRRSWCGHTSSLLPHSPRTVWVRGWASGGLLPTPTRLGTLECQAGEERFAGVRRSPLPLVLRERTIRVNLTLELAKEGLPRLRGYFFAVSGRVEHMCSDAGAQDAVSGVGGCWGRHGGS